MKKIATNEVFKKAEDGSMILISSEVIEYDEPTAEELIYAKELELMRIYEEIQAIKSQTPNEQA